MKLTKIPRNIFQTWFTKNLSPDFKSLTETWKTKNPNYAYFLHDDYDCEEFIKKNFDIKVYNAYCRIIPGAFKADLWRYCILYIYGGIYVDIDTICHNEIDVFLNESIEFMTPIDLNNWSVIGTHNLFNAFIASVPKHPILLECINRIVYHVENNIVPYSNLDFTGPGVLGRATNVFLHLDENTSFIGKQGMYNNNTICLLHFECGSEYVKNEFNTILFQNKNGNAEIKNIYAKETKNNSVDWGKCKTPIKPLPTIVTMIYDIRAKENNTTNCGLNHNMDKYLNSAKQFILTLPYPLVIFTDADDNIIEQINNERINFKEKTYIYKKPFEETYFFKDKDILPELQTKFTILNGNTQHETPFYIILNNNKFDFIESAIDLNPFNSNHFIWMDFGINHVAQNTEIIHEWINKVPDKIKQLCINPYVEGGTQKNHFKFIYHNMAGGLFSGSKENLLKYSTLFKKKTDEIYNDNWYQIDEAVMTMVNRENPDLFDLFYGDYQGIISNYLSPIHNMELIIRGVQKLLDHNKTKEPYDILCYSSKFFNNNKNHNLIYEFVRQHIIVDYYNNNRHFLTNVIEIINYLKNKEDNGRILHMINMNKNNISYYENSNKIL